MDFQEILGKKEGRTPLALIVFMLFSIFLGLALYAAKVNLIVVIAITSAINIIAIRYLYLMFGKKPVLYFLNDYLIVVNPLLPNRRFKASEVIAFQSRIISWYLPCLTVKHYKGNSICETILGGDFYEHDLDRLPNLLNKAISQYNGLAKSNYGKAKDKSAAVGLFAFSSKSLIIMAIIYIPSLFVLYIFVLHPEINTMVYGALFYPLAYLVIAILYFKHLIPNIVFQYVNHFLVVYSFIFSVFYYTANYLSKLLF